MGANQVERVLEECLSEKYEQTSTTEPNQEGTVDVDNYHGLTFRMVLVYLVRERGREVRRTSCSDQCSILVNVLNYRLPNFGTRRLWSSTSCISNVLHGRLVEKNTDHVGLSSRGISRLSSMQLRCPHGFLRSSQSQPASLDLPWLKRPTTGVGNTSSSS